MNEQSTASLSPDTEAILLLCGRFGSERGGPSLANPAPLTQKEYERLTKWLLERKLRPADLLGSELAVRLGDVIHASLEPTRVESLISRGTALALALEKWQRSGLWVLSRSDLAYPKRLKKKLGQSAPPLLYGAGEPSLLDVGGLAVVGSRNASETALEFTRNVARACARDDLGVISGGAKGVDVAAMQGAGEAGGVVVGVLAADLLRASVNRQNRMGIQSGQLVLVSPFNPEASFNAGNAMARNRYIYALADYALVVDSAEGEGGTWAGATEDLRHGWTPLYVRTPGESPGNAALIAKGAQGFTYEISERASIRECLEKTCQFDPSPLFGQVVPEGDAATTEQLSPAPVDVIVTSEQVAAAEVTPSPGFDMFQDFVARLPLLLGKEAKTDEDIRLALGLEKGQLKVWLAAAVEQGLLEKRKKPVSYALPRQKALC
ncbi:MAG: DNA-processing protein DprA [Thauera sp.]|jgi:predicted Rossmann fold nucleotide-binding protein DprA/Smf involved in DNA uptake|nr:MAG: DNA-processing protein DprA [Thauera sp.]